MGDLDDLAGKAKEAEGKISGDDAREAQGKIEQGADKAGDAFDEAQERAGDAKDRITGN